MNEEQRFKQWWRKCGIDLLEGGSIYDIAKTTWLVASKRPKHPKPNVEAQRITFTWHGLEVEAHIKLHEIIGDSSIPRGTTDLGPYVETFWVEDSEGFDMLSYLNTHAEEQIMQEALELYSAERP